MATIFLSDLIKLLVDQMRYGDSQFVLNPKDEKMYEFFSYDLDTEVYVRVIASTEKIEPTT